jgi:hypothetical protein
MKVGDKVLITDKKVIQEFIKESCEERLISISTSFAANDIVLPDSITGTIVDFDDEVCDFQYHIKLDDLSLTFKDEIEDGYFRENELQVI